MREPERLERRRAALIAYAVCRRALTPSGVSKGSISDPGYDFNRAFFSRALI